MFNKVPSLPLTVLTVLALSLCAPASVAAGEAVRTAEDPRPLAEMLDELGRRYGVFFTYDAAKIAGKEVDFTPAEGESLEDAIERLLAPTNLGYEVLGDKYFVLFEASERGRREASRLRRKVRQLDRLEKGGARLSVLRADADPGRQLREIQRESKKIALAAGVGGTVLDESGQPLLGVSIRVLGTSQGTVSDGRGQFTLSSTEETTQLEFSYLGYGTRQLTLRRGESAQVRLKPVGEELPEVLIVGYGTIQATEATASVAQVERDALAHAQAMLMPQEWLQGRVAGVQVLGGNGEPGAFQSLRIRGSSSMNASNEPLYVIDGMPVDNSPHAPYGLQPGRNPLNALNPADVEKVTVLKDAAAGAIYGSRAANGVVLIETRKSRLHQPGQLTYNAWVAGAEAVNTLDVYDAAGYRDLVGRLAPHRLGELGETATNWQAAILRPAFSQQHTLGYGAGNDRGGYRISLGYLQRESIVVGTGSERLSAALNGRRDFFDHQLQLQADAKLARLNDRFVAPSVFSYAYAFDPTQPLREATSPWGGYFEYDNDLTIKNPLAEATLVRDESRVFRLLGNVRLRYLPAKISGLEATVFVGNDRTDGLRNLFAPSTVRYQYVNQGEFRYAPQQRDNRLVEAYLNYVHRYASDRLGASLTAGYTYQHFQAHYPVESYLGIEGSDYAFGRIPASDRENQLEEFQENRLASVFGRTGLDWRHKYFLTASFRVDGSSRFSPSHRWASFPAVSLAWRISEEPFMQQQRGWVDELKLRAGWGLTGNQEIGDYQYLPTITLGDATVRYPFGEEFVTTARPNAVSADLKWEQTSSMNLALEGSFFSNRLQATLEAYQSTTKDLLSRVIVPAGSNLSDIVLTNIGSIRNHGVEFSLDAKLVEGKAWQWSLGFNLATNQNRILSLGPSPELNFRAISTGNISGGTGNTIQVYQVGQPLNAFYVFAHRRDAQGRPLPDGVDHNGDGQADLADIYEDTNGDGVVNDRDKRAWQQPSPRFHGGLQSRLSYRGFGLRTALRWQVGNYVYNNLAASSENYNRILSEPELLNVPRSIELSGFRSPQFFSDYYVEHAAFLRMDALTLEYTLPVKKAGRLTQCYLSLQNVFTLTAYRGLDPEVGNASGNPSVPRYGIDDLLFPTARTLLLGVNTSF